MIAKIISGGRYSRTTHPTWKYRFSEDLVIWTSHCVEKPIAFRSHSGYIIGKWEGHLLTIYSGYMFDGASGWWDHELAMPGFGFHDFGYQLAQILTRKQWDQGMLATHAEAGYKPRHLVYAGVRAGGWQVYGKRDYVEILYL